MKKLFLILVALIGFGISANAQNIIIQQNNQINNSNGKEVIGIKGDVVRGIEVEILNNDSVRVENFNTFAVECEFEIHFEIISRWSKKRYSNSEWWSQSGWERSPGDVVIGKKVIMPNKPFVFTRGDDFFFGSKEVPDTYDYLKKYEANKAAPKIIKMNFYKF